MNDQGNNRHKGEWSFPEAGDGAVIRFTVADLARLESIYTPGGNARLVATEDEAGQSQKLWRARFLSQLFAESPRAILDGLAHGLKKTGGKEALSIDLDDPPFLIKDARLPITEAFFLAVSGKTWTETLTDRVKDLEEEAAKYADQTSDPTKAGMANGSPASSPEDTAQG